MAFLRDKNIYILLITVLLAHGLLLLNDGVYWDGWLVYRYLKDHNYEALYQTYKMAGTWGVPSLYLTLNYFGNLIFIHKFVVFCCIYTANIFAYFSAKRLNLLSDLECLFIGMLSIAYSSYQAWHELMVMPYAILYAIFYVAVYLLLFSCDVRSCSKRIIIKTVSVFLFLISFSMASLLAYYYAGMLLYYVKDGGDELFSWRRIVVFLKANVGLMLLPIVYRTIKVCFSSPFGKFSGYNKIVYDPAMWIFNIMVTLRNSVNVQLSECITNLIEYPLLIVLVGLVVCVAQAGIRVNNVSPQKQVSPKGMLIFGVVALLLAIFPYAAVGIFASSQGWSTRHSLLMYIPISIIIVAVTKIGLAERITSGSRAHVFLILMLVAGFVITDNKVYMQYQLRWVKDKAFISALRNRDNLKNYSMYLIHDNVSTGIRELYRGYEYSSMFKEAWGGESRYGIDMRDYDASNTENIIEGAIVNADVSIMSMSEMVRSMYILSDYRTTNKIINIYLKKMTKDPDLLIFLKYYYYKFVHPERMEGFLVSIVSMKSCPFVGGAVVPAADGCAALSSR